jgi:hypothetical protein
MSDSGDRSQEDQHRTLYEQSESRTAQAFEELVGKPSFGVLMARSAENVVAITRIGSDVADLLLRNLRLAGRADITRLALQLHRTEDKLERVLQEVEDLRDGLGSERGPRSAPQPPPATPAGASGVRARGRGSAATLPGGGGTRVNGR